jgi:predicted TIM-barrel fold metal-dependent hydrolase
MRLKKELTLILDTPRLAALVCAVIYCASCRALEPDDPRGYVDAHAHVAGIGAGDSGNYLSPALRDSWKSGIFIRSFGVTLKEVEAQGDRLVIQRLAQRITESQTVSRAVVLALDGVYRETGTLDFDRTQIIVSNDYLIRELAPFDNLLFGASVNPMRQDALEQLEYVKANGAVLIKLLPAIMLFDPSAERFIPYYRKLVELNLPLLIHAGKEGAFAWADNRFSDPALLRLPLEQGVRVIVAHIATLGKHAGEPDFERVLPMFAEYGNLYTDISSLTQINKRGYLKRALKDELVTSRMIYGTDWPLQFFPVVSAWYHVLDIGIDDALRIGRIDNQWDRDVELKRAIGVPDAVFRRTAGVLNLE